MVDALASELPVGMFTGYFFNPAYLVELRGQTVYYLKKQPAFLEGKFLRWRSGGNCPNTRKGWRSRGRSWR